MKNRLSLTILPFLLLLYLLAACSASNNPNPDNQIATAIMQILAQSAVPATQSTDTPSPPTEIPSQADPQPRPACIPSNPIESAHVIEITDGDTIHVSMNGQEYTVRYIGIDTPEMEDGASAEAAKQANAKLVLDQDVMMVLDVNNTDKYDRLLRYVMVGDIFVNQQLVLDGLATAKAYPPDTACNTQFKASQSTA
jgi:micrococcal nuclease